MASQLNPKEIVDLRELLMSGIIQSEALINLLDRKGIITKEELPGGDETSTGDLAVVEGEYNGSQNGREERQRE